MYKKSEIEAIKIATLKGIEAGNSLAKLEESGVIPNQEIVFKTLNRDANFKKEYAHARLEQVRYYGEKIERVLDKLKSSKEKSRELTDIARLEIDSYKWIAGRMMPGVYGKSQATQINLNIAKPIEGMVVYNGTKPKDIDINTIDVDSEVVESFNGSELKALD